MEGLYGETLSNHDVTVLNEHARITGDHQITLASGKIVTARYILIATGARPFIPDFRGNEHVITSNEAFHLDAIPRRILIAGGGYIANEFAGIFNEFGSKVTLANRSDTILRGYDESVRDRLLQISLTKGIRVLLQRPNSNMSKNRDDGSLRVKLTGQDERIFDVVMVATGRVPNIEGLGLETIGVECGKRGEIVVDTSQPHQCRLRLCRG